MPVAGDSPGLQLLNFNYTTMAILVGQFVTTIGSFYKSLFFSCNVIVARSSDERRCSCASMNWISSFTKSAKKRPLADPSGALKSALKSGRVCHKQSQREMANCLVH